jgi:hypothetical protein
VFTLAGYLLLAPPVFLFGPLAGLLLLARPRTPREWVWVIASVVWSVFWLQQTGGLPAQVARAAAVFVCGTFLALTLWRPSARMTRALTATLGAMVALALWMRRLGLSWDGVRRGVEHEVSAFHRTLVPQWTAAGVSPEVIEQMRVAGSTAATLFPALLVLAAVAGLRLAWAWHHRIAIRPLGQSPGPFRAFGFSDHLVWGWVVGLGLCLLPVPGPWNLVGSNLLLVWAVLYATRGLAVVAAAAGRTPGPVIAVLGLIALFLLPFVLGGLTLLGLADTWLDFRRRLAAPNSGGLNP